MTNIRRIAHPPREARCIARLLLMQVILVCVAHAAQKAWMKRRTAGGNPGVDVMPEKQATVTSDIGICEEDPAAAPRVPLRTLWELITGMGASLYACPAGPVFPVDSGQCRLTPGRTAGY